MKYKNILFIAIFSLSTSLFAQEQTDSTTTKKVTDVEVAKDSISDAPLVEKAELERAAFESTSLIETQTNRVFSKGTIEMIMNHRFGLVNGTNDMIGVWAPSNIRLALTYAITDRITVGFGTTKDQRLLDFSLKAALLRQTVNKNIMPVSISYYGNVVNNSSPKENFEYLSSRFSFFNQLIITKRFDKTFSFLLAPSYTHFNSVKNGYNNDVFAMTVGGRAKIAPDLSILVEYTNSYLDKKFDIKPGFSAGLEMSTVGHAFQLFVTNYRGIINQQNVMFNQNDFFKGQFAIGFNITRSW